MGLEDKGLIYHITNDTIIPKYNINVDMKIPDEIRNSPDTHLTEYKGLTYKFLGYVNEKFLSLPPLFPVPEKSKAKIFTGYFISAS